MEKPLISFGKPKKRITFQKLKSSKTIINYLGSFDDAHQPDKQTFTSLNIIILH